MKKMKREKEVDSFAEFIEGLLRDLREWRGSYWGCSRCKSMIMPSLKDAKISRRNPEILVIGNGKDIRTCESCSALDYKFRPVVMQMDEKKKKEIKQSIEHFEKMLKDLR
ncbi:MAG TPA: hypothetical protein DCZ94_20075 [Lentisphaeria bacterium]|nr:MAG: hypothetical protein A2X48_14720 [Lentisphaerae bacterium GWF2_49_21]HBC89244.1 hypothetical protein [Lentisphaeria bacterium]